MTTYCAPCLADLALVREATTAVGGTASCMAHAVLLTHPADDPQRRRQRLAQLRESATDKLATVGPEERMRLEILVEEYSLAQAMESLVPRRRPDGQRPGADRPGPRPGEGDGPLSRSARKRRARDNRERVPGQAGGDGVVASGAAEQAGAQALAQVGAPSGEPPSGEPTSGGQSTPGGEPTSGGESTPGEPAAGGESTPDPGATGGPAVEAPAPTGGGLPPAPATAEASAPSGSTAHGAGGAAPTPASLVGEAAPATAGPGADAGPAVPPGPGDAPLPGAAPAEASGALAGDGTGSGASPEAPRLVPGPVHPVEEHAPASSEPAGPGDDA